jgi:pyrroline-5-carboxylate reductase
MDALSLVWIQSSRVKRAALLPTSRKASVMTGTPVANDSACSNRKLLLIGGGKMGLALLKGWLKSGRAPDGIIVVDPKPADELREIVRTSGVHVTPEVASDSPAATVVLAVKPQTANTVLSSVNPIVDRDTLVISIMAGVKLSILRSKLPQSRTIVRAMPNLPASVGRGAIVAVSEMAISSVFRSSAKELLEATGTFEWLSDESQMDVVTGLSGSGPGYLFYVIECLAQAGIGLGLNPGTAHRLARSTLEGAGELLHQSVQSPAELRVQVTSTGGTTEAGLRVLMDGRLQQLITATVRAAATRSSALSNG